MNSTGCSLAGLKADLADERRHLGAQRVGPAAGAAALLGTLGLVPKLTRILTLAAGGLGPVLATYTAVLVSDTATPVWHEARAQLPFVSRPAQWRAPERSARFMVQTPVAAGRKAKLKNSAQAEQRHYQPTTDRRQQHRNAVRQGEIEPKKLVRLADVVL